MHPAPTLGPLTFNGIDGTNDSALPPVEIAQLCRRITDSQIGQDELQRLAARCQARPMGPKDGVDPRRLEEAGWAAVLPATADPAVWQALEPLFEHRRQQAARLRAERFRKLGGPDGYRDGESALRFLARQDAGSGPADPDRLPYYLLLVGGPEEIPYSVEHQLDVQYAVGRLAFDTPEEYRRYAEAVVATETASHQRRHRAVFFGVRHEDDVTESVHDHLVVPLANHLRCRMSDWEIRCVLGPEATHERLGELLGGTEIPSFLFTGSHGLGFPQGNPLQREQQGGLVCQDWEGPPTAPPGTGTPPYFTADDVSSASGPQGLIAFLFACWSAGTPRDNSFYHRGDSEVEYASQHPFVARLPQRLLGHPKGGALAVVGHVDRAWTLSYDWPISGQQTEVFASTLRRLLAGYPLGSAMEFFSQRYAELQCALAELRRDAVFSRSPDLLSEIDLWTACQDARSFVVLGDPAVRLPGGPKP